MKLQTSKVFLSLTFLFALLSQPANAVAQNTSASSIPTVDLLQPTEFAAILQSPSTPKPLMLQVGSHVLFAEAHIPGSEYAGPTGQDTGLQVLRDRVAKVPRDTAILLYCGCCPWSHCPNIAPAYNQLHSLGFNNVKVLYLADNFGANWVDKGYPTAKGR